MRQRVQPGQVYKVARLVHTWIISRPVAMWRRFSSWSLLLGSELDSRLTGGNWMCGFLLKLRCGCAGAAWSWSCKDWYQEFRRTGTAPKLVVWFSRVQVTNMWGPHPPFTVFKPPWATSEVENSGALKFDMSMLRMEQNLAPRRYFHV